MTAEPHPYPDGARRTVPGPSGIAARAEQYLAEQPRPCPGFRPYRHRGRCWDAGAKPDPGDRKCRTSQRPKDWDDRGRAEANA